MLDRLKKIFLPPLAVGSPFSDTITDIEEASQTIYGLLASGRPCFLSRFGSVELSAMKFALRQNFINRNLNLFYRRRVMRTLSQNAGFFPVNARSVEEFAHIYIEDAAQIDILGSWLMDEDLFADRLVDAVKVKLSNLEPYFSQSPWTMALEGKKVLVVHPFADTIMSQYEKRERLFDLPVLPQFGSLECIKAVQSIGGSADGFDTWFDALEHMKRQVEERDFDIALIGCGAYGLPLGAHCKRMGRQSVHLGGALQLLFGIIGRRWFDPASALYPRFKRFLNPYWVRPQDDEKPAAASKVEGGCYW